MVSRTWCITIVGITCFLGHKFLYNLYQLHKFLYKPYQLHKLLLYGCKIIDFCCVFFKFYWLLRLKWNCMVWVKNFCVNFGYNYSGLSMWWRRVARRSMRIFSLKAVPAKRFISFNKCESLMSPKGISNKTRCKRLVSQQNAQLVSILCIRTCFVKMLFR